MAFNHIIYKRLGLNSCLQSVLKVKEPISSFATKDHRSRQFCIFSKPFAPKHIYSQLQDNASIRIGMPLSTRHLHLSQSYQFPSQNSSSSSSLEKVKNIGKLIRFPNIPKGGKLSFLSVRSLASTPLPFLLYGLGGIIPFAAAPLYTYYSGLYDPTIAYVQLVYGATILSFLGGVSWGESLPHAKEVSLQYLAYSITLPLIGWISVLLHPNPSSFLILMSAIGYAGYNDTQNTMYPVWFRNLRLLLSSVVFLCLFSTAVFSFTKPVASDNNNNTSKD